MFNFCDVCAHATRPQLYTFVCKQREQLCLGQSLCFSYWISLFLELCQTICYINYMPITLKHNNIKIHRYVVWRCHLLEANYIYFSLRKCSPKKNITRTFPCNLFHVQFYFRNLMHETRNKIEYKKKQIHILTVMKKNLIL